MSGEWNSSPMTGADTCGASRRMTRSSTGRSSLRIASATLLAAASLTFSGVAEAALSYSDVKPGFDAIEHWRIDAARDLAQKLNQSHPDDALTLALIAAVKLHQSDYGGAVTYFDRAKRAGAPTALLRDAPLAEAARVATDGYVETVSDHFIIRHQPGKDAVLVPYALETLEAAMERLGELLGWRPKSRVVVEFYPSASTLAAVSSLTEDEIKNSGTIALCKWNRLMVTTPRAIVFGYGWRDTVSHELVHLVIGGASKNSVPIWLHEGIAKFAETAWRGEPGLALSVDAQKSLRKAAKSNKLIPFEKMHPSMAKLPTQEDTSLAFAEVFTFIEYMVAQKGWDAIRQILFRLSQGATEDEAVQAVFGTSLTKLSKKWMATLATRPIKTGGATVDRALVIKDRSENPDDKLHGVSKEGRRYARAADLLYARGRLVAAQRELEKAYGATQSPLISAKLANVALATGDLDGAEKAARDAMNGEPDLPGPNVTLAEVLVRKNKLLEAKEPLDRAIGINPFDPRIHSLRLAVLAGEGEDKNKEARYQAQIALAILTGDGRIRPPVLGTGGLVEIASKTFSRVFILSPLDGGGHRAIATGMITPTAPLALKPGSIRIRLVPPKGEPIERTIAVAPTGDDGAPQRVAPDTEGS